MVIGGPVLRELRVGGFEDYGAESWQVRDALIRDLDVGAADIIPIYSVQTGNVDDVEALTGILAVIEEVKKDKDVVRIVSYYENGASQLVSKDRTKTFL